MVWNFSTMLNLLVYPIHSIMKPEVTAIAFVSRVLTVVGSFVALEEEIADLSFLKNRFLSSLEIIKKEIFFLFMLRQ